MSLPLKLEPFEWFMFENMGQERCASFSMQLVFEGKFDPSAFTIAVRRALRRHPLLNSNVVGSKPGNLTWVPAKNPGCFLDIAPASEPCRYPLAESIDLRTETGLRIWARYSDRQTDWRFQIHHACCDGLGASLFIEDVMCAYDQVVLGCHSRAEMRPLDQDSLSIRGRLSDSKNSLAYRAKRSLWVKPGRLYRNFTDKPYTFQSDLPSNRFQTYGRSLPDIPHHIFSRAETRQLRKVAQVNGATSNDLLARELMLTIDQWRRAKPNADKNSPIRIFVPVSLRSQDHDAMSAANSASIVSLTRQPESLNDGVDLLHGITQEMQFIRDWQIEQNWIRTLALIGKLPGSKALLRRQSRRSSATSLLTNIGKVLSRATLPKRNGKFLAGQLSLQRVLGAPPANKSTPVTFGVGNCSGELTLGANYDPSVVSAESANELLGAFVNRLKMIADNSEKACAA